MSARSVTNEVSTAATPVGDMDTMKRLIELQSQLVELSQRNAATEKSVALLRHEVAQIRRGETTQNLPLAATIIPRAGLLEQLRARVRQFPRLAPRNVVLT